MRRTILSLEKYGQFSSLDYSCFCTDKNQPTMKTLLLFGAIVISSNVFGQQTYQKTYPDILNSKGIGLEIRNDTVFITGIEGVVLHQIYLFQL